MVKVKLTHAHSMTKFEKLEGISFKMNLENVLNKNIIKIKIPIR